jgi:ubiquinone biosynthesis protein
MKEGQRRNRLLVIGSALVLCAALIYGLDGYRPAMVFNAPALTWILGALGAVYWWRASRP